MGIKNARALFLSLNTDYLLNIFKGLVLLYLFWLWSCCFGLWLLLSGYFDVPLLLVFGVLSCVLVVFIAWRVEVIDPEQQPFGLRFCLGIFFYWPWLMVQIVLANIDVARRIINPELPISPTMITLKPTQYSDLGRVIYANSITLTPGTVTTAVNDDVIQVHALNREAAQALEEGDMDRRVATLERQRR